MISIEDGLLDVRMQNSTGGEQPRPQCTVANVDSQSPGFEHKTDNGQSNAGRRDARALTRESEETYLLSPPTGSIFGSQTVALASYNVGQPVGEVITVEFQLTSGTETLITLWKTRFNHDQ